MIFLYIYLALYVGTLAKLVYDSHKHFIPTPFVEQSSFLGFKTKEPIWQLAVIAIFMAPISIPVLIFDCCRKLYYKNRPRPVKKSYRSRLKVGTVLDETNSTVSLSEYNYKHGTNFTLEDVYGKKYVASLTKEELESMEKYESGLTIEEGLDDEYKEIAISYARARLSNDYSEFVNYLADDVVLTRFEKGRTLGKDDIVAYFKRLYDMRLADKERTTFNIKLSPYNHHAVSEERIDHTILYTLFLIKDNKVVQMTLTPWHKYDGIGYSPLDRPVLSPEEVNKLEDLGDEPVAPKAFHFPCPHCGKPSESLTWRRVELSCGHHGYVGDMSVCPDCGSEVEMFPDIRARY